MPDRSIAPFLSFSVALLATAALAQDPAGAAADEPHAEKFHQNLAWSPDGKRLAYTELEGGSDYRADAWTIWIIDADGQSPPEPVVENALWVDWSPDGRTLAYDSAREGNGEVYALDLDRREVRRLTENPAKDGQPAWSPDGGRIVFSSDRNGDRDLFLLDVDSLAVTPLTSGEGDDYNPHWTPDGARVVFYRELGDHRDQVWSIAADGSLPRRLSDPERHNVFPQVFADGSVLWSSSEPEKQGGLVRWDPETGETAELLAGIESGIARPSPDGGTIAFVTGRWPKSTIWLAAPDGSNQRRLVN